MARHGITLEITPLKPPTRLTAVLAITIASNPPTHKRSARMQYPTVIKHNRFALAHLMRIHGSGRLYERSEACERLVELMGRVEREGRLERRAVAHGGHLRLYATGGI